MKRRAFLRGVGATAIAVGAIGCDSDKKQPENSGTNSKTAPVNARTPAPTLCQSTPLKQQQLTEEASILMVFMLASTQRTAGDCRQLAEDFFNDNGPVIDPNAMTRWGFDPTTGVQLVQSRSGMTPAQLRAQFNAIQSLFTKITSYSGPDCPGPNSILTIVKTAANVKVPS